MPYLLSINPHPSSSLTPQLFASLEFSLCICLPCQLLKFFQVLHQPSTFSTSTICQRCHSFQSHHFAPRVLLGKMFLLSVGGGKTRVMTLGSEHTECGGDFSHEAFRRPCRQKILSPSSVKKRTTPPNLDDQRFFRHQKNPSGPKDLGKQSPPTDRPAGDLSREELLSW